MKKFTQSLLHSVLMAAVLFFTACEKGEDVTTLSNYETKLKAVSEEVARTKKNKDALLLVTFGSTWDSPQVTFKGMKERFAKAFPDRDVYFAFTSNICITRCAAKGWNYYDPTFYLKAIGNAGYTSVAVQSLHIIPGEEFLGLQSTIKAFHNDGEPRYEQVKVFLGGPLLAEESDVNKVAAILHKEMEPQIEAGKIITFMGHGNPENMNYGNGNSRYPMMEKALQKFNKNYFVATVDMDGNYVDNMIERMQDAGLKHNNVICHPLMSIAGDHANNDMKGGVDEKNPEEGSWRYALSEAGYNCPLSNCIIKGLADYPEIVDVWIEHTRKALASPSMFEE